MQPCGGVSYCLLIVWVNSVDSTTNDVIKLTFTDDMLCDRMWLFIGTIGGTQFRKWELNFCLYLDFVSSDQRCRTVYARALVIQQYCKSSRSIGHVVSNVHSSATARPPTSTKHVMNYSTYCHAYEDVEAFSRVRVIDNVWHVCHSSSIAFVEPLFTISNNSCGW